MPARYSRQYRPVTDEELYTDGRALSVRAVRDLVENAQNYHGRSAPRLLVYDLNFPLEAVASADERWIAEYDVPVAAGIGSAEFLTIEWKIWAYLVDPAVNTTVRVYSHLGMYAGAATPFVPGSLSDQRLTGFVVINSTTPQWWQGTTGIVRRADGSTSLVLTFDDDAGATAGITWGFLAAWLQPLADV